jgi:hypothetical protein
VLIDALPVTAVGITDPKEEIYISGEATLVEDVFGKPFFAPIFKDVQAEIRLSWHWEN